jgi:hypothetical protein
MSKQRIIRMNSDGPEGVGLEFLGNLESEKVLEGEPVEKGFKILQMPQASLPQVSGR